MSNKKIIIISFTIAIVLMLAAALYLWAFSPIPSELIGAWEGHDPTCKITVFFKPNGKIVFEAVTSTRKEEYICWCDSIKRIGNTIRLNAFSTKSNIRLPFSGSKEKSQDFYITILNENKITFLRYGSAEFTRVK
jgi:hypothetical protein